MKSKWAGMALLGLLIAVFALVAAGCGGDDEGGGGTTVKIVSDLPLQGSDRVQTAQMVRGDRVRARAGRQQGRRLHDRVRVVRRLDRRGRQVGRGEVRRERAHLRGRRDDRRRDRHVQLGLRGDQHPDPERGRSRDGQPGEHVRRPDARRRRAPSRASPTSTTRPASATTRASSRPTTYQGKIGASVHEGRPRRARRSSSSTTRSSTGRASPTRSRRRRRRSGSRSRATRAGTRTPRTTRP